VRREAPGWQPSRGDQTDLLGCNPKNEADPIITAMKQTQLKIAVLRAKTTPGDGSETV